MYKIIGSLVFALGVSNVAHASAAVNYTCAGYQPNASGSSDLINQSLVFTMTGANDEITLEIISKSIDPVDSANALLTTGKDCKFSMDPDEKYPAYRVSVSGKCGTKINQNFKGTCFFDL